MPLLKKLTILYKWFLTDDPTTAAIDITHRCNLKCLHCYWWKQAPPPELNDEDLLGFMKALRAKGLRAAILYGGEPALRPEMCRAASHIFDATLAFTNGTVGFPELDNGQWILSLDGTKEVNDAIRGKGVFELAVENVKTAPHPPIVHITLSRLNRHCIRDFVRTMLALPVKGIGFSFYTPSLHREDTPLFIPLEERDRVVLELLSLRREYGERIGFTSAMARQLLSTGDYTLWNSFEACPVGEKVRCFCSDGRPKRCTYGDDVDCSRCGCAAVVAYRGAFTPLNLQTLRVVLGLMLPEARAGMGPAPWIRGSLRRRLGKTANRAKSHPEGGVRRSGFSGIRV